ncbi:MAG: hypothetical protein HC820_03845 [Hydrococcus sp. RM1_1_31]|nr:hypothetical protein [Hydrococcus sp. RM1_1_31]
MMMNKKLPKIFLASAIALSIMGTGAVRASTQPMDWEAIYEDTLFKEESNSTEEVIRKVPPIVSAVRQIFSLLMQAALMEPSTVSWEF